MPKHEGDLNWIMRSYKFTSEGRRYALGKTNQNLGHEKKEQLISKASIL